MGSGMSGPAGAPALLHVPMGRCREPGNAMAPLTEARSAGESGWRRLTVSCGIVQVGSIIVECVFHSAINMQTSIKNKL